MSLQLFRRDWLQNETYSFVIRKQDLLSDVFNPPKKSFVFAHGHPGVWYHGLNVPCLFSPETQGQIRADWKLFSEKTDVLLLSQELQLF